MYKFGFLREAHSVDWSMGSIAPLENHASVVGEVENYPERHGDVVYPRLGHPPKGIAWQSTSEVFRMPSSHTLTLKGVTNHQDEAANFLIAFFGLLNGLRLQREGWNHFYACPIKPGFLSDFHVMNNKAFSEAMEAASAFWQNLPDELTRRRAYAVIHWHQFAQLYPHDFERFQMQYVALDACWKLWASITGKDKERSYHAQRPKQLADTFGLHDPTNWAKSAQKTIELSNQRNALVHEGLYNGQPIGFVVSDEASEVTQNMTNFVARCIFAIIGIKNSYTSSATNTFQIMGFD